MNVIEQRIGHGQLGFRGKMRTFEQLIEQPVYDKRVSIEARPGLVVSDWTLDQGDTFQAVVEQTFDDVMLDVPAVRSALDAGLVRVETLADCRATPGTFFYDFFSADLDRPLWDDGTTLWDDGDSVWDEFSVLFVHLFDGSDPNETIVTAQFGIFFANRGEVHPSFGPEKLTNGNFEDDLTGWAIGLGNGVITVETANPLRGDKSARWLLSAVTDNFRDLNQTFEAVQGETYRIAVLYSIEQTGFLQIIVVNPSGDFLQGNGRDYDSTPDFTNLNSDTTRGTTRRLIVDFRANETGTFTLRLRALAADNPTAPATWDDAVTLWDDGSTPWDDFGLDVPIVLADNVSVRRIYRFNYHEARLASGAVASVQTGSRDIYFTAQQIGSGKATFVNGDAFFEDLVELFNFESNEMFVSVGGAFPDGDELLIDDYRPQFKGIVRRDQVDDSGADFNMEDVRSFILQDVPPRTFNLLDQPGLDLAIVGQNRAIWFGPVEDITPDRISLTSNFYGIYELADPTDLPNGITSVDEVRAFLTSGDAQAGNDAKSVVLTLTTDYTVDLPTAQITIVSDAQVIEITDENNAIDFLRFDEKVALISTGFFTPRLLCIEVEDAMELADPARTYTCTYDESTNKFNIAKSGGGGNFELLTNTGANLVRTIFNVLGYNGDADKTGAQDYDSDTAIYDDIPEDQHFLRVDGVGARDTVPVPEFTGVSGDPIQKGADITRVLWENFINQPRALIDSESFIDARTTAPQPLGVYIKDTTDLRAVFQKLQNSNRSNIVIDGDGIIRYIVNQPGVIPDDTPTLDDADYISFSMRKMLDDVFSTIRIFFKQNPSTKAFLNVASTDETTAGLFQRTGAKEFETYLTDQLEAVAIANGFITLSEEPPRLLSFTTKGLIDKVEGQKLIINRDRGIDSSGTLTNLLFRILLVRKEPDSAQADITAVEDI